MNFIKNPCPRGPGRDISVWDRAHAEKVRKYHETFPQYAVTPLVSLKHTAAHFGVKNICVKNENARFGLGAFKVLGGSYAVGSVIAEKLGDLADYFGVAEIDEAVELRKSGVTKPILILGYTDETEYEDLLNYDITQAVYDVEKCRSLSLLAEKAGKKARVHIKVDSGMHRIGFRADAEGIAEAEELFSMPGLSVEGIFTHFAKADEKDKTSALEQYRVFSEFVHALEAKGHHLGIRHIDNSAGAMELHSKGFDMMRLGIVIYGLYPSEEVDKSVVIRPAMQLVTHITHIKTLPAGCGISYGHTYVTEG